MKPVLLLIPGMLNTAQVWSPVASLLQDAAEVRIASVLTQSSIFGMARDAWATVVDVPAETPLVVCGFSMGGYTLLEMLANPARPLSAVALLDTSARPETPEGAAVREKTIVAIERNFAKVVDGVVQFAIHPSTQARPERMEPIRQVMLDTGAETAIRQNRAIMGRADHRAALAQLRVPALVMCGREDRITPPELSIELAGLIPGARLEWIENAGHMSPMEQPARVAALLRTLLQDRPTRNPP